MNLKRIVLGLVLSGNLFLSNNLESRLKYESETVVHISGSRWSWEGLVNGDYAPRTNRIFDKLETSKSSIVSGGFEGLKLFSRLGTYTDETPKYKVVSLLKDFEDKIDKDERVLRALVNLLRDNSMYVIFKEFFNDNGRIKIYSGLSFYKQRPLSLNIYCDSYDIEEILFHEALHYVFDKVDSVLYEAHDVGGADHYVITPLEDRFRIIRSLRDGEIPIDQDSNTFYGFIRDGKIGDKLGKFIEDNDLYGLKEYLGSSFKREYVRAGMIGALASNEYYDKHTEERIYKYKLSCSQLIDIAFLHAVNGAIIWKSFEISIKVLKDGLNVRDAFKSVEFQEKIQEFLMNYVELLDNPKAQPYKSAEIAFEKLSFK